MLEGCAKIEVKLMSRVLGRLWGHQGRLWETPWGPQTNLGVRKGQLGSSSWSQDDPWSVQVGCKSVQVGSKSPTVRPTEPTARPTDYIYKLPINRSSGPILITGIIGIIVTSVDPSQYATVMLVGACMLEFGKSFESKRLVRSRQAGTAGAGKLEHTG